MRGIIFWTLVIATVYFLSVTYLMNYRLAVDTTLGGYPLSYKTNVLFNLVLGMWSVMGTHGLMALLVTAVLTGANLTLLFHRLAEMSRLGNLQFVVGGSSVVGIVTSGCAACGLPFLSILGITGSLAFLPFKGVELSYISVLVLLVSLYLIIRSKNADQSCKVRR